MIYSGECVYGISGVWECKYDRLCYSHQAKHAVAGNITWGVDGDTGSLADMTELGVWDPLSVKVQTYKTAIEVCVVVAMLYEQQTNICDNVLLVPTMDNGWMSLSSGCDVPSGGSCFPVLL